MIKRVFFILFISCFLNAKTVVIPIEGEIDPSILKFLERAINEATNYNPNKIVFRINTFGGRVDTTYEIVDLILSIKTETISVVEEKAISAGTLIALSSESLYMMKNSTLGDVAPIIMGQDGPKMLGEKFQSPLRAKFRSLAHKNGYPVKLSEAFVSDQIEIIELTWKNGKKTILSGTEFQDLLEKERENIIKKKTIVKKGELLTLSDQEAKKLGFSSATIEKLSDILGEDEVIYIERKTSEKIFSFLNKYSFILIVIGLGGIYLEVKNPGFGIYGITAIVAFSIFFLSHYVVELATYIELVLLIIALILIIFEIFILPGMGVFGISGMVLLFISLILMMQKFTFPVYEFQFELFKDNLYTVILSFLFSSVFFLLSLILFPKILKNSPIVFSGKNDKLTETISSNSNINSSSNLIGKKGITYTNLKPSGFIEINGRLFDASSEGDFIKVNEKVIVTSKRLGSLIVKKVV